MLHFRPHSAEYKTILPDISCKRWTWRLCQTRDLLLFAWRLYLDCWCYSPQIFRFILDHLLCTISLSSVYRDDLQTRYLNMCCICNMCCIWRLWRQKHHRPTCQYPQKKRSTSWPHIAPLHDWSFSGDPSVHNEHCIFQLRIEEKQKEMNK